MLYNTFRLNTIGLLKDYIEYTKFVEILKSNTCSKQPRFSKTHAQENTMAVPSLLGQVEFRAACQYLLLLKLISVMKIQLTTLVRKLPC